MLRFIEHGEQVEPTVSAFQYIPCYGLSYALDVWSQARLISIHPMLRFIHLPPIVDLKPIHISIHPMLRFIFIVLRIRVSLFLISIHPMLRFIIVHKQETQPLIAISIHPMLRFIKLVLSVTL